MAGPTISKDGFEILFGGNGPSGYGPELLMKLLGRELDNMLSQ